MRSSAALRTAAAARRAGLVRRSGAASVTSGLQGRTAPLLLSLAASRRPLSTSRRVPAGSSADSQQASTVPVGPYMEDSSSGAPCASSLPAPPGSSAAPSAASHPGMSDPDADLSAAQRAQRASNVRQLEEDHAGGNVPTHVRVARGIDGEGSAKEEEEMLRRVASQRGRPVRPDGRRKFSTLPNVPRPVTNQTGVDEIVAQVASASAQRPDPVQSSYTPSSNQQYQFTKPVEAESSQAQTGHRGQTQQLSGVQKPQQQQQQQQQQRQQQQQQQQNFTREQHRDGDHQARSSGRRQEQPPFPFSMPDLSALRGPLTTLAGLATPTNLSALVQLTNPATALSAATKLATPQNIASVGELATALRDNLPAPQAVASVLSHAASTAGLGQVLPQTQASGGGSSSTPPPPPPSSGSSTASSAASPFPGVLSAVGSGLGSAGKSLCSSRPPTKQQLLAEILRVDHAGEYGAQRIYDGQLAVLGAGKKPSLNGSNLHHTSARGSNATPSDIIEEMRAQEIEHLRTLEDLLPAYRVRPTALLPLWNVAGFGLGAASALLGPRAAMACTVAVEEVITAHYNAQLRTLNTPGFEGEREQRLKQIIRKHRDDEEEHRDIGLQHDAEKAPLYKAMHAAIQAGCHAAIWISKRI